jgi:hypothetical protein
MGMSLGLAWACFKNGWYKDNRKVAGRQALRREKKRKTWIKVDG